MTGISPYLLKIVGLTKYEPTNTSDAGSPPLV